MASSKSTAVAETKKGGTEVGEALPDFMKGKGGAGVENVSGDDVGIPRLALLQALSPQIQSGDGKPGDWYHLMAEENLGSELRFIPIIVTKSFMLWRPRDTGGGLLARSDDGINWVPANADFPVTLKGGTNVTWSTKKTVAESRLDQWGSSNPADPTSLPAATKMMNVLCWLPDYPELSPVVLTLQRSSLKPGKKFLGKLKMSAAPAYGLVFKLTSETANGKLGTYQSPVIVGDGFVKDENLFNRLEETYRRFKKEGVRVNVDGLQEDGGEDGVDNEAGGGNAAGASGDRDF